MIHQVVFHKEKIDSKTKFPSIHQNKVFLQTLDPSSNSFPEYSGTLRESRKSLLINPNKPNWCQINPLKFWF